jgi:ABC-2 type transport system permease protein
MKNPIVAPALRFYGYLKKDTVLLYKRKKYLYTFILLPILIASLFLFALNPSDYTISVGVCDYDNTQLSQQAFQSLQGFDTTLLPKDNCYDELIAGMKRGNFDLGIEVPQGFTSNLENLKQGKLVVHYDNTDIAFSNLVSWKVDNSLEPFEKNVIDTLNSRLKEKISSIRDNVDFLLEFAPSAINSKVEEIDEDLKNIEEMDTEFLVNPIWTDKRGIYGDVGKSAGITFIFPVLALFITLMLASTSIIYDKKNGFIIRVKSSSSPLLYLLAKTIFFTLLVLIQFLIILILFWIYGSSYSLSIIEILKLVFCIGAIDTLIGFIIGLISENEGIAVLFSLIISFPLMLVSGLFFPIQTLPKIIQFIAKILPLQFQINSAKGVLLFGDKVSGNWIYGLVILFVAVWWLLRKR